MVVVFFLLFSVLGRFGVALLGFASNIEETLDIKPPLFRPDWQNLTLSRRTNSSLGSSMHDDWVNNSVNHFSVQRHIEDFKCLNWLFNVAQTVNGPPWLIADDNDHKLSQEQKLLSLNLSMFSSSNHAINVVDDKVLHTYRFQDLRGTNVSEYAEWDLLIETKCQRFKVLSNNLVNITDPLDAESTYPTLIGPIEYDDNGQKVTLPYTYSNLTNYPITERNSRWIQTDDTYFLRPPDANETWNPATDDSIDINVIPQYIVSSIWFMTYRWPGLIDDSFDALLELTPAESLLFNCTISIHEVSTAQIYRPPWPGHRYREPIDDEEDNILNSMLETYLRTPFSPEPTSGYASWVPEPVQVGNNTYCVNAQEMTYLDVSMPDIFNCAISRKDKRTSEIWLAAYMGNYIVNSLDLIGDIVTPIEIQGAIYSVRTKLLVKWGRVVAVLAGLATFQLLLSLVTLLYCRGNFEITDNVSTLSSILETLPLGQTADQQGQCAEYLGTFVTVNADSAQKENVKFLWVFKKKQE